MSADTNHTPEAALKRIIESAQRLGIELDEAEALQWMTSLAASQADQDIPVDVKSGVYGHKVVMLDFSPQELAHFREIGRLVEFKDQPGVVETALALSGSSAQSKIQTYPGDADYFERVNIKAGTRRQAGHPETAATPSAQRRVGAPRLSHRHGSLWWIRLLGRQHL